MPDYGTRNPGDTVLWNDRRYLTKTVMTVTEGRAWYLTDPNQHNAGFGEIGPVAESDLIPVMPQVEYGSLKLSQRNANTARMRLMQAADQGFAAAAAATPSWMAVLRPHHSLTKDLHERYPHDNLAKTCYEQADAWMKE